MGVASGVEALRFSGAEFIRGEIPAFALGAVEEQQGTVINDIMLGEKSFRLNESLLHQPPEALTADLALKTAKAFHGPLGVFHRRFAHRRFDAHPVSHRRDLAKRNARLRHAERPRIHPHENHPLARHPKSMDELTVRFPSVVQRIVNVSHGRPEREPVHLFAQRKRRIFQLLSDAHDGIVTIMRLVAIGSFVCASLLSAEKLTSLGESPDWSRLDPYQDAVTFSDFRWLLESQFAPRGAAEAWIDLQPNQALIKRHAGDRQPYVLTFRDVDREPPGLPAYWAKRPAKPNPAQPLAGLTVALDPGHLGGEFAVMEHRSWRAGDGPLFREGDFVLQVARKAKAQLEALGARVALVRAETGPVTTESPESLRPIATELLAENALTPGLEIDAANREQEIRALANLLFFRVSEIRARAARVNQIIQPDLVLCLHVDATNAPPGLDLAEQGHAHYLVNGAYSADELSFDDQRLQMLEKMLSGAWREERGLANAFAEEFARVHDLPPYTYHGDNAVRINENPYVWARNLLANRLYQCPTVFLEPYVANSADFYPRFTQAPEKLADEYAEAISNTLVAYYGNLQ